MSFAATPLSDCLVFQPLSVERRAALQRCSRRRALPARHSVYVRSESTEYVYLLHSGLVRVCHLTGEGKRSILALVQPGELFGELNLFEPVDQPERERVETAEPSEVLLIPRRELRQLMFESTEVAIALSRFMGLRRYRVEQRLRNLLFLSHRERLVHLLLDLAEQFGRHSADGLQLSVNLSHQDLADFVGSTRETVTTILGQLKSDGLVNVGRRRIVLREPDVLADSVNRRVPAGTEKCPDSSAMDTSTTAFSTSSRGPAGLPTSSGEIL